MKSWTSQGVRWKYFCEIVVALSRCQINTHTHTFDDVSHTKIYTRLAVFIRSSKALIISIGTASNKRGEKKCDKLIFEHKFKCCTNELRKCVFETDMLHFLLSTQQRSFTANYPIQPWMHMHMNYPISIIHNLVFSPYAFIRYLCLSVVLSFGQFKLSVYSAA